MCTRGGKYRSGKIVLCGRSKNEHNNPKLRNNVFADGIVKSSMQEATFSGYFSNEKVLKISKEGGD